MAVTGSFDDGGDFEISDEDWAEVLRFRAAPQFISVEVSQRILDALIGASPVEVYVPTEGDYVSLQEVGSPGDPWFGPYLLRTVETDYLVVDPIDDDPTIFMRADWTVSRAQFGGGPATVTIAAAGEGEFEAAP